MRSHQLKLADDRFGLVHLFSGKDGEGEAFYAYIVVTPSLYEEYIVGLESGTLRLTDYGVILHCGPGKEPSQSIRQYMELTYGVCHNFMEELSTEIRKRQEAQNA